MHTLRSLQILHSRPDKHSQAVRPLHGITPVRPTSRQVDMGSRLDMGSLRRTHGMPRSRSGFCRVKSRLPEAQQRQVAMQRNRRAKDKEEWQRSSTLGIPRSRSGCGGAGRRSSSSSSSSHRPSSLRRNPAGLRPRSQTPCLAKLRRHKRSLHLEAPASRMPSSNSGFNPAPHGIPSNKSGSSHRMRKPVQTGTRIHRMFPRHCHRSSSRRSSHCSSRSSSRSILHSMGSSRSSRPNREVGPGHIPTRSLLQAKLLQLSSHSRPSPVRGDSRKVPTFQQGAGNKAQKITTQTILA